MLTSMLAAALALSAADHTGTYRCYRASDNYREFRLDVAAGQLHVRSIVDGALSWEEKGPFFVRRDYEYGNTSYSLLSAPSLILKTDGAIIDGNLADCTKFSG